MRAAAQQSGQLAKHALGFSRGKVRRKKKPKGAGSLRARVRALLSSVPQNDSERELQEAAKRWLHNKRSHQRREPQRIGRTNRVKGGKK